MAHGRTGNITVQRVLPALLVGAIATCLVTAPVSSAAAAAAAAAGQRHGSRPAAAAAATAADPGTSWNGKKWGDAKADAGAKGLDGRNDPAKDIGSLLTVTDVIGARSAWGTKDSTGRAITGQGVDVALLDTGVATDVAGLSGAGKVLTGPDLSLDANAASTGGDGFGHGTHLAGIIAGRDTVEVDPKTGQPKPANGAVQLGVAPDARLVSLKLATRDGSTDVSQVIAGLDWIVQHRNDNGMKIRVVNLSYGTNSAQSYLLDPLAAAVENAWNHGIVVVVSGGNDGTTAKSLTDPAYDPFVIAVGASDPQGTTNGWKSPVTAAFSSRGTAGRHVDLVAPGTSIASLRDPGSFVDVNHPEGLVAGDTTRRLFRGSGTSQAAAVVSGAVALLLQACPQLNPDQVKAVLTASATPVTGAGSLDAGAGEVNVTAALKLITQKAIPNGTQRYLASSGLGRLEAARGDSHLIDPDTGAALNGEVDVQGNLWLPVFWVPASRSATAWNGGRWNGATWTGSTWTGTRWASADWSGRTWRGVRWSDADWSGRTWRGAAWQDDAWL